MREPRSFTLPAGRDWPGWWLVVSVLVHVVVLSAVVQATMVMQRVASSRNALLLLSEAPAAEPQQGIVWPGAPRAPRVRRRAPPGAVAAPPPAPGMPLAEHAPAPAAGDTAPAALRLGAGGSDSTGRGLARTAVVDRRGLVGLTPQLGTGLLWVQPVAQLLASDRPIRIDSVVAVRMRAMADSIEQHPLADPNADPYVSRPWTFKVGGKTYGLDSRGLHLGDFTIPTALLAFLAMPQGNIDQARANAALMEMRADILRAAARSQAEDDFRQAVRDIRTRKQKEHDEERAREHQGNPQPAQP